MKEQSEENSKSKDSVKQKINHEDRLCIVQVSVAAVKIITTKFKNTMEKRTCSFLVHIFRDQPAVAKEEA